MDDVFDKVYRLVFTPKDWGAGPLLFIHYRGKIPVGGGGGVYT